VTNKRVYGAAACGYQQAMDLIATTAALNAACERLSKHPFVTVDTEFLRETTFWPKLCVVQPPATKRSWSIRSPKASISRPSSR
jgi:ribonuclease D